MEVLYANSSNSNNVVKTNLSRILNDSKPDDGLCSTSEALLYLRDKKKLVDLRTVIDGKKSSKNAEFKFPRLVKRAFKTSDTKPNSMGFANDSPSNIDSGSNLKQEKKKKKSKSRRNGQTGSKKKKRSPKLIERPANPYNNLLDALQNLDINPGEATNYENIENEILKRSNDSLRWEFELGNVDAELARIETYKQNRRKRYIEERFRILRAQSRVKFDLYDQEGNDEDSEDDDDLK